MDKYIRKASNNSAAPASAAQIVEADGANPCAHQTDANQVRDVRSIITFALHDEGVDQENARKMLWLETVQLIHRDRNVEMAVADPDSGSMKPAERDKVIDAILASPHASNTLKRALNKDYKPSRRTIPRLKIQPSPAKTELDPPSPVNRSLRAYAFDPSLSGSFNTFQFNQVTLEVPWESLGVGPTGEYVEVIDHDPASGCYYPPVDLDHKHLLATDGLAASTSNPQFHQQMAYAIAMRTYDISS